MKVKIDIFSGFLGAGKTLLMKKLLEEGVYTEKIAIIENEFGEVSIDGGILRETNIEVREINSGCICCQVTGDFKDALLQVISDYSPTRLLIEPSGVAKLSDIKNIFSEKDLIDITEVDNVITVIDPLKIDVYLNNFKKFYKDQVISADKIVFSRCQFINESELLEAKLKISRLNRKALLITKPWDTLRGSEVIKNFAPNNSFFNLKTNPIKSKATLLKDSTAKNTSNTFSSIPIYVKNRFSKDELIKKFEFLSSSSNFGNVLRAKGIVNLLDGNKHQFDFVPNEFNIRKLNYSPEDVIIIIGTDLKENALKSFFN
ncbi:GTP-binding protein [Clostridium gasigenes]|uniref:CobW family GTP-binding protein n=1 Tax=Clostridium gasigenes TaxID=94869 RepID=UPI001C0B4247|nr:GTP-binding protein [Clostridium gasigenes]MBU3136329.1 GTP-binding protein [Clostridium gasigenes]